MRKILYSIHKLEERQALYGIDCPPHILLEVEDMRAHLKKEKIRRIETSAQMMTISPSLASKGNMPGCLEN